MNIVDEGKNDQAIFINASLSSFLNKALLDLIKEYKDIFACIYVEMPGLGTKFFTHQVNIKKVAGSQVGLEKLHGIARGVDQIRIKKLLDVGFIKSIQQST